MIRTNCFENDDYDVDNEILKHHVLSYKRAVSFVEKENQSQKYWSFHSKTKKIIT